MLQPKARFRLWLTAEVHPRFPPILLQSTLKITYEVGKQQPIFMLMSKQSNSFRKARINEAGFRAQRPAPVQKQPILPQRD